MTIWQKLSVGLGALMILAALPNMGFAADAAHPTVVELFQSQGCSSCPPAEANVAAVSDRADVLALAFEVDYWDRLGWKDTFSKAAWTARQYAYAHAMARDGVYTPQVVVNGRVEGDGLEPGGLADLMRRGERGASGPTVGFAGDAVAVGAALRRRAAPRCGSRATFRARSKSRFRAAKTPAAHCRTRTWCARWYSSAVGMAMQRCSRCRAPATAGLAEAAIVQAAGAGPILGGGAAVTPRQFLNFCRKREFSLARPQMFCICSADDQPAGGQDGCRAFRRWRSRASRRVPSTCRCRSPSGTVVFMIVGLGDKAVAESRERVRAALIASGLALPAKRITVNLAPADMPKEGSHYDLPIALGVMAAIGAIPPDALDGYAVIGELALDGTISAVAGVLPAAIAANARGQRPHLSGRLRPRGGLGLGRSRHSRAALADPARQPFQGDAGALAPRARVARRRPALSRTCATSRARRAPSARSKWPRPAATIC